MTTLPSFLASARVWDQASLGLVLRLVELPGFDAGAAVWPHATSRSASEATADRPAAEQRKNLFKRFLYLPLAPSLPHGRRGKRIGATSCMPGRLARVCREARCALR